MSNAASLIARLAAEGVSPDLLGEVAMALASAQAAAQAIEKRRASDRDRQAKRRDHVTSRDVTGQNVTTRDPSPKDNNQTPTQPIPPVDPDGSTAPKGADGAEIADEAVVGGAEAITAAGDEKPEAAPRARRIPADFADSPEARAVCAEMGLSEAEAAEALAEFCDFWMSEGGAKARKLDWPRTLRNRLREVGRRRPSARASPQRARSSNGYYDLLRDDFGAPDDQRADPPRQHLRLAAGGR